MFFKKENFTITNVLIACVVIYLIYHFTRTKETFENVDHSRDDELATFAYEYLVSPSGIIGSYERYFKFLREAMNVNPILSDKDTFNKFKELRKSDKLSKAAILDFISEKATPKVNSGIPF
jgi:hypothetical protein